MTRTEEINELIFKNDKESLAEKLFDAQAELSELKEGVVAEYKTKAYTHDKWNFDSSRRLWFEGHGNTSRESFSRK